MCIDIFIYTHIYAYIYIYIYILIYFGIRVSQSKVFTCCGLLRNGAAILGFILMGKAPTMATFYILWMVAKSSSCELHMGNFGNFESQSFLMDQTSTGVLP